MALPRLAALAALLALALAITSPAAADFVVRRGIATHAPFMDRSPANMKWHNRIFGDASVLRSRNVIADIRAAGFDTVRMPVHPRPLVEGDEATVAKALDEIEPGIRAFVEAGLKVVVDLHTGAGPGAWQNGGLTRDPDSPEFRRFLEAVEALGRRVARFDPERVAYEPFNEPPSPCTWTNRPDWPVFMKRIFDRARQAAPRTWIVVTGACWANWEGLTKMPTAPFDARTLYTFHFYDPHIFTHQGARNPYDPAYYVTRLPYPPRENRYDEFMAELERRVAAADIPPEQRKVVVENGRIYLRRYFSEPVGPAAMAKRVGAVAEWARRNGISPSRVFVGEFGVTKDLKSKGQPDVVAADPEERARWFRDAREAFEAVGFGWVAWNYHYQGGLIVGDEWGPLDPIVIKALGLSVPRQN